MKEAFFYSQLKNSKVQCDLCPNFCVIDEGAIGSCFARKNIGGKLFSLVYARACAAAVDPIEKKPLFHFLPGTKTFSIGTTGCNLHCKQCQNFETAQSKEVFGEELKPALVVAEAIKRGCKSISYTYNEPTVFYEYVLETAELAHKAGLKNIMVTNGYINIEPIEKLYPFIDAANIDLKGFNEKFYNEICMGKLKPILEAIKKIKEYSWVEITNLVIPTMNDNFEEIDKMSEWISNNLGKETPIHFSRFFPYYKLTHIHPTPIETLMKAKEIAEEHLYYVYVGNIDVKNGEDTFCPRCKKRLVTRIGFNAVENNICKGKCPSCGLEIKGVFE